MKIYIVLILALVALTSANEIDKRLLIDISSLAHQIENYLRQHGKELTAVACTAACDVLTEGIGAALCGAACSLLGVGK